MSRLNEIKERARLTEKLNDDRDDVNWLLSKLDIAQRALEKVYGTEGYVYLRDALDQLKE